ncbi:MarR family winged helix-turn-helix transcriptional regulator [Ideonella sp. A 288]|uniref:MarR family winged helix-turn-helix transcriptional regulator n=1 Tax=Ideonella sp. A 288 TaxID=1962181 RepID=UPI000B4A6950|nr:MarR family transcriptional regulator [Ideonella sp. A 288]
MARADRTSDLAGAEPTADLPTDRPNEAASLSLGPLTDVLGYHIAQAAVVTYALFERHIGQPHGLRKVEYSMLMLLLANGPLSPKRLIQALALSAPNLTLLLDRLQERGLIRRERSQVDRRSQNIVLTAEGGRIARATAEAAAPMERELLDRLSRAEHAMLIELLGKVAGRL